MARQRTQQAEPLKIVRCAIYTRKSSEQGLDQEFNSLDAQREACEAFITSQRAEGWVALEARYDDGGFTGANTERPALNRLMANIAEGKVDLVVVYKVDRLSRSLLDFAGLMRTFEERGVGFVSITQQFNTASSMGRLVLNVLLSFAQFEREVIAERTRDKMAATRRKGKFTGGPPLFGYDLDPARQRLVINEAEAQQVREIFALYVEKQSLVAVAEELNRRGWATKRTTSKKGNTHGGKPWTKPAIHRLLINVTYKGKVRYREELHQGEHEAIIDEKTFGRVQATLASNDINGGADCRNSSGAILKGLIHCGCGAAMTPSHSTRGAVKHRYYRCNKRLSQGKDACPTKPLPAGQIEQVVLDRIRAVGSDPALQAEVLHQAREQADRRQSDLAGEQRSLERDLAAWSKELLKLSAALRPGEDNGDTITRLAELQQRIGQVEQRVKKVKQQVAEARVGLFDDEQATEALASFDGLWAEMTPAEQARVVALLVESIHYDGTRGKLTITFAPAGIQSLAERLHDKRREQRA